MEPAYPSSTQQQHANTQNLPSQPLSKPQGSKLKRKRSSQGSPDVQKSPQVNKAAASGDNTDQDPDKKKSKLGYQRSTIACGMLAPHSHSLTTADQEPVHCRRRKIRCVIPDNDRSGKCAHCIRMKKACSFVPVDSAGTDKKKKQVPLRKAMSEPSPVHTPHDASKESNSWYYFDFDRPATGTHHLLPSSYAPGSLDTTTPLPDDMLAFQGKRHPFCFEKTSY